MVQRNATKQIYRVTDMFTTFNDFLSIHMSQAHALSNCEQSQDNRARQRQPHCLELLTAFLVNKEDRYFNYVTEHCIENWSRVEGG